MTAPLSASLPEATAATPLTASFTFLIATSNYAPYIEDALRGALAQNDDGSRDTETRLAKSGDAIGCFKKPEGGQASAFTFALQHPRREYLALLGADDVWLPDKLPRTHQAFQNQPDTGMAYHRLYQCVPGGSGAEAADQLATLGHVIGGLHHFDDFCARRRNRRARSGNSGESSARGDAAR
jgi:glycosyltransferase involved in cell wall biosynthesis